MASFPSFVAKKRNCRRAGPFYDEIIATSKTGKETRACYQLTGRYRWTIGLTRLSQDLNGDEVSTLCTFIAARRGRYDPFTFTCPLDGTTRSVRFDTPQIELERIVNRKWQAATITLVSVL